MMIEHKVLVRGAAVRGKGSDPSAAGAVLQRLDESLRGAADVAFRRSSGAGRRQPWLKRAGKARLQHAETTGAEELAIYFEAPRFADVAAEYFEQQRLFAEGPDQNQTAFDVLAEAFNDVMAGRSDSDRFDRGLLHRFCRFKTSVFRKQVDELVISGQPRSETPGCRVSRALPDRAEELYRQTPEPALARISGRLDMIEASTLAFALVLPGGEKVRGIWKGDDFETLRQLVNRDVVATGTAVYRPSRALLRIDAETLAPKGAGDDFFATLPTAPPAQLDVRTLLREQRKRGGVAGMWGKLPAEESDEEFMTSVSAAD